jgi:hypothetical protein
MCVQNGQLYNMDNLFAHPGFRLIYVSDNGMSLITPLDHQEAILENGYRCISHLWGNATRWEDHPIKNISWGVDMRKEKRERLLQVFNHYKGYWWMDVFCTDQDSSNKPLSIMGDVYRKCKECICMLDIKIPDLTKLGINEKIKHVCKVSECKWSKRVWTFQEWMLPPRVLYTSEADKESFFVDPDVMFDIEADESIIEKLFLLIFFTLNFGRIRRAGRVFQRKKNNMYSLMLYLAESERKCRNDEDYYYGIAGVFNIPLTDGLSFLEVEKEFLFHFKNQDYRGTTNVFDSRLFHVKKESSFHSEQDCDSDGSDIVGWSHFSDYDHGCFGYDHGRFGYELRKYYNSSTFDILLYGLFHEVEKEFPSHFKQGALPVSDTFGKQTVYERWKSVLSDEISPLTIFGRISRNSRNIFVLLWRWLIFINILSTAIFTAIWHGPDALSEKLSDETHSKIATGQNRRNIFVFLWRWLKFISILSAAIFIAIWRGPDILLTGWH